MKFDVVHDALNQIFKALAQKWISLHILMGYHKAGIDIDEAFIMWLLIWLWEDSIKGRS